jgi:hypothetical protein
MLSRTKCVSKRAGKEKRCPHRDWQALTGWIAPFDTRLRYAPPLLRRRCWDGKRAFARSGD